jgi:hypothetical protein
VWEQAIEDSKNEIVANNLKKIPADTKEEPVIKESSDYTEEESSEENVVEPKESMRNVESLG